MSWGGEKFKMYFNIIFRFPNDETPWIFPYSFIYYDMFRKTITAIITYYV